MPAARAEVLAPFFPLTPRPPRRPSGGRAVVARAAALWQTPLVRRASARAAAPRHALDGVLRVRLLVARLGIAEEELLENLLADGRVVRREDVECLVEAPHKAPEEGDEEADVDEVEHPRHVVHQALPVGLPVRPLTDLVAPLCVIQAAVHALYGFAVRNIGLGASRRGLGCGGVGPAQGQAHLCRLLHGAEDLRHIVDELHVVGRPTVLGGDD
mmetsp:Transcript_47288/g.131726  ORF Transcript_47288/g.131726 Transcript_47288/m.131726 type:complete len:214 (-) Transcript_47288:261-902(-)